MIARMMKTARTTVARRTSLGVAAVAAIWAALIGVSGGLSVKVAGVRITSHSVVNPILLALIAVAVAAWLARPATRATIVGDLGAGLGALRRVSPATYLLIGAIALRVWYWLLGPPLWLDEEMIALNIRGRSLAGLTGELWLGQAAPLGWLITERIVGLTVGFGEMALRAVPVAFGVATLVAAWWAGRRWMSAAGAATLVFIVGVGEWMFHFSIELKHYSADTFFGLLMPALVVWALEGRDGRERLRRASIWWMVAIAGQLWSMGGLLVAPACAIALVIALWRRDGIRSAVIAAAVGCAWLATFALHYALTLRFAVGSSFLQGTWSNRMAPEAAGLADRLIWVGQQAAPLALNPGGAALGALFWAIVICGFAVARPRLLGALLAAIPASAAVLGIVRVTPLYERFTIWALPAVYFGIALALDAAVRAARTRATAPIVSITRAAGVGVAAAAIVISADIARHGYSGIPGTHHAATNHALDDRSAVEWLAAERRPGDVFVTTHLGAPAVWWYAGPSSASAAGEGAPFDGMPVVEMQYHDPNPRCDASAFENAFAGHTRALVYFGFEDVPRGFKQMALDRLTALGTVATLRSFGDLSIAAVVDLAPAEARVPSDDEAARSQRPCFSARAAARW